MASRVRVPRTSMARLYRRAISQVPPNAMAIYTAFPATLYYYSPHRVSNLYDCREMESRPYGLIDQAVCVANNGLVYPRFRSAVPHDPLLWVSNGAVFMPNTTWMQELYRLFLEQSYYDALDDGEQVEAPYLYTVAKGTPVPGLLILIREDEESFSLQPSQQGLTLNDFNRSLDEFYDEHALKETASQWFGKHPLRDSIGNSEEHMWMSR
ncbi:hypothetical protein C8A05DRAFT_48322 [Staphylotrichum tortipilum]|uniref:Tse2 ADP-ribosyltransferase toxin domain-containing protein n=1 Tax=Staphylotrichum tortipilum TaxID=2831512 RepID=A0AAN6M968_9PEZI|nr:hypothetical protein C8A05DRAFT_48322 [Staphylotrichum longicolle]